MPYCTRICTLVMSVTERKSIKHTFISIQCKFSCFFPSSLIIQSLTTFKKKKKKKHVLVWQNKHDINLNSALPDCLIPRGGLDSKKAADDHHGEAAGNAEERIQQLPQTCPSRARAVVIRDGPGYAGCAGRVMSSPACIIIIMIIH